MAAPYKNKGTGSGTRNVETGKYECDTEFASHKTYLTLLKDKSGCTEDHPTYKQYKNASDAVQFENTCYDATKQFTLQYYRDADCTTKLDEDADFKDLSMTADFQYYSPGCNTMDFSGFGFAYSDYWKKMGNYVVRHTIGEIDCAHSEEILTGKTADDIELHPLITDIGTPYALEVEGQTKGVLLKYELGKCYSTDISISYAARSTDSQGACADTNGPSDRDESIYYKIIDLQPAPAAADTDDSGAMSSATFSTTAFLAMLLAFAFAR